MNTKKFDIHWTATQAEIRHWMKLVRRAQAEGRLRDCRFGMILCLAYARDNTGECLPTIKAEGDTLYYALRKDFHIKRNLGHT